ncbi:glycosyltransferase [Candidatus Woesearchaeota archaeon]|nr:glycosyltransferase [Candidatus Woesearchaeota archaeon]
MKAVITIPAFNEEKTLPDVLEEIKGVMKKTGYDYQILVVDDGSSDKTSEVAKKAGAAVFRNSHNKGLAETFKVEMQQCLEMDADIIVHTDADGQYDAKHIPELIKKVEQGYDLVIGSRFLGKIEAMPFMKRLGNRLMSRAISMLTRTRITDATSGFRAFTKDVAGEIDYINTFTYTHEQIIRAARHNFRIAEIPIYARKTRPSRLFKSSVRYAFRSWLNILRIYRDFAPLGFFGLLGAFFILAGMGLGIWIVVTLAQTGSVGGIPRVILSALFLITGVQIIIFGFLADMLRR